jgi:phospholipid/cholesterol/gamma-HCH transport system permease protein
MLLLGTMGFLIGMVMTYQLTESLVHYGANTLIVNVLGLAMMRELGPVSASLIVMARSGSSITAGIGAMHIEDELLALRAFGASPTQRLILPKLIAMMITVPLLVVWTDFMGMLGGIITTDFTLDIGYKYFVQRLPESVPWINFWIGLGKGVLFGFLIAVMSSYFGLKIRSSTYSLSEQTTNSVVAGLSLIIVIDAFSGSLLTNVGLY